MHTKGRGQSRSTDTTPEVKQQLNTILKELLQDNEVDCQSHSNSVHHVYTDGSGTGGRCTQHTPAGWGWCYKEGNQWKEAYGPVTTGTSHITYRGATVGSNNAGEVTAIIEAGLFAHQQGWQQITTHTDSQWAINTITGRWRSNCHHDLIQLANKLSKLVKTHFQWVKRRSSQEGNERADKLADKGKQTTTRRGSTAMIPILGQQHTSAAQTSLVTQLQEAAKQGFAPNASNRSKPWITEQTLDLLSQARTAEATCISEAKQKRNQAASSARKDRIKWIHDQLVDPRAEQAPLWRTVRRQKQGFRGRKGQLIVNGQPIPWSSTHKAFRDHLQNNQWAPNRVSEEVISELKQKRPLRPHSQDHQPFTLKELAEAINKLKKRRAPGPDHIANELFLLLWSSGEVPTNWKEAIVVSIYKGKGTDTDPANYRRFLYSTPKTKYLLLCYRHDLHRSTTATSKIDNSDSGPEKAQNTPCSYYGEPWNGQKLRANQGITWFWIGNKLLTPLTTTPCL